MIQRQRTSTLSLKLDVIVKEDDNNNVDKDLGSASPGALHDTLTKENIPSCTITIRNVQQTNSNDPQFLHSGKWPKLDMVDILVEPDVDIEDDELIKQRNAVGETIDHQMSNTDTVETPPAIDTWGTIDADQLSMAMDLWDPEEPSIPSPISSPPSKPTYSSMDAAQHSLFMQEITEENLARTQTVEHIKELEDNDNAIEIVATLEGYRQSGWAVEMIKAFPKQCWIFWSEGGLADVDKEEEFLCEHYGYPLSR